MGCFSTCFLKSKRRKSPRPTTPTLCSDQFLQRDKCAVVEAVQPEILRKPILDSINDGQEEKLGMSGRKKVTFDLDVQFYQELPAIDENHGNEEENKEKDFSDNNSPSSSSSSSLIALPPKNYRYHDCRDSDDDELVDDSDYDYMGDDEDEGEEEEDVGDEANKAEDESDESLFSRSMDSVNYDGGDEIKRLESVLHPIENLTQWKSVQARDKNKVEPQNEAKENRECEIPFIAEPVVKPNSKNDKANKAKPMSSVKAIAVDTSLSSWLTGAEAVCTPSKSRDGSVSVGNSPCSERTYSPKEFEDRPILGVLTIEEIRQFSATSSTPRRSPSRRPDDMPIIGSVGSYWN